MASVPLSQPYIPKTLGHRVWVCGTRVAGTGTLNKLLLENKDLASIFGTVLGTAGPLFGAFKVSQPLKNFKALGQPAIRSAGVISLRPTCPWCGRCFSSWPRAKLHVKNCAAAPRPRWKAAAERRVHMDRQERGREILQRAEAHGFDPEYSAGFVTLRRHPDDNPEAFSLTVTDFGKYLPEISAILRKRATAMRGKELVGSRIFSQQHGAGTLLGADEEGGTTISISVEARRSHEDEIRSSQMSITAKAETLLIIVDESVEKITGIDPAKPAPEKQRKGVFEFLRGSAAGSSERKS